MARFRGFHWFQGHLAIWKKTISKMYHVVLLFIRSLSPGIVYLAAAADAGVCVYVLQVTAGTGSRLHTAPAQEQFV